MKNKKFNFFLNILKIEIEPSSPNTPSLSVPFTILSSFGGWWHPGVATSLRPPLPGPTFFTFFFFLILISHFTWTWMLCFGAFGYVKYILWKIFYLFFMFDILRKLNQYKIFHNSRKITIKKNKKQPIALKIFMFYKTTFASRKGDNRGVGGGQSL